MARAGKWLKLVSPQESAVDAAQRGLGERLALVWQYLRRSSRGACGDPANIHQLRVNTRRSVEAIRLFAPLLPERRRTRMLSQLKRIRRAAGTARDLDVMLERFAPLAERGSAEVVLVQHLHVLRQQAQRPIEQVYKRLKRKAFRRQARKLVRRVKVRPCKNRFDEPAFADLARAALEPRLRAFFCAASADFSDEAPLHAFRIQGKHLRYAMELFAGAFAPGFKKDLYPCIAELQDRLGKLNDHATARDRFIDWLAKPDCDATLRPLLESLAAEEQKALEQCRIAFIAWWTPARYAALRERFAAAMEVELPAARGFPEAATDAHAGKSTRLGEPFPT